MPKTDDYTVPAKVTKAPGKVATIFRQVAGLDTIDGCISSLTRTAERLSQLAEQHRTAADRVEAEKGAAIREHEIRVAGLDSTKALQLSEAERAERISSNFRGLLEG